MILNLNYEGFEDNLVIKIIGNGVYYRFRFKNNYGASIVKHPYSYGNEKDRWELCKIIYILMPLTIVMTQL